MDTPNKNTDRELVQSAAALLAGLSVAAPAYAASPVISEIKVKTPPCPRPTRRQDGARIITIRTMCMICYHRSARA